MSIRLKNHYLTYYILPQRLLESAKTTAPDDAVGRDFTVAEIKLSNGERYSVISWRPGKENCTDNLKCLPSPETVKPND